MVTSVRIMEAKVTRPVVSNNLIDCLRALDDFWNSGSNPLPGASVLASAERMAKSGKESSLRDEAIWDDVRDPYRGVRVDDAFRKLAPVQQVCIRTHFFWSAATPLAGIRYVDWREFRKIEAEHAALPEQVYERALINSIAEMERACA